MQSSEVRVTLTDFRIYPAVMTVSAGRIKIRACNTGIVPHNARVEETYTQANGSAISLGGSPVAVPGKCVVSLQKLTLGAGTYKIVDTVSNHNDLGDFATLTVH
jgi:hypothetical protein